ncbi:16647_t:CDS:1, partial [Funneliformis geosporum]
LVVNYLKEYGRNSAATHFKLNPSMVRRWVKASTNWKGEVNRNSRSIGYGRK